MCILWVNGGNMNTTLIGWQGEGVRPRPITSSSEGEVARGGGGAPAGVWRGRRGRGLRENGVGPGSRTLRLGDVVQGSQQVREIPQVQCLEARQGSECSGAWPWQPRMKWAPIAAGGSEVRARGVRCAGNRQPLFPLDGSACSAHHLPCKPWGPAPTDAQYTFAD